MNENTTTPKRLYRSRRHRILAGVGGGMGQYFGVDPVLFRLGFVALTFATGFGLLLYIVLAIVVPNWPEYQEEPETTAVATFDSARTREIAGIGLIGFGLLVMASNMGMFRIVRWDLFWPLVLIGIGTLILVNRTRG
jgi:phage shock protein C